MLYALIGLGILLFLVGTVLLFAGENVSCRLAGRVGRSVAEIESLGGALLVLGTIIIVVGL